VEQGVEGFFCRKKPDLASKGGRGELQKTSGVLAEEQR